MINSNNKYFTWLVIALSLTLQTYTLAQNLIINGSAELETAGKLSNWTEVIGTDWVRATEVPAQDGNYIFFPRKSPTPTVGSDFTIEWAELSQNIDLSSYSSEIDAGIQNFIFNGYTRTWISPDLDVTHIILEYYDVSNTLLTSWDSGPHSSVGTSNSSTDGWQNINNIFLAPVGTRSILIRLRAQRRYGNDNDGYFDNLSLEPACVGGSSSLSSISICETDSTSLSLTNYSGDIQWQTSINSGGTWNNIGGANNSNTIKVSSTNANSPTLYRAEVSRIACTEYSSEATLTIQPSPTLGTLTSSASELCEGESLSLNLAGNNGTIQWQRSYANGPWGNFGNTNTTQSETPTLANSPAQYRAILDLAGCIDTTSNTSININTAPIGGTSSILDLSICDGDSTTLSLSSYSGNIQWQDSSAGSWSNIGLTTNSEIIKPSFANSPTFYRAILSTGSCSDTSTISNININESPNGGTISSLVTSLCENETTILSVTGSSGSMQWQESLANGVWGNVGTSTTQTSASLPSQSPAQYRLITTLNTCKDTSNSISIDIFPQATGGIITGNNTICDGTNTIINLTGSSGIIQWQEKNVSTWADFGTDTNSITISPNIVNSPVEYRAVLTAGSCTDTSDIFSISITPAASGGSSSVNTSTLCNGSNAQISLSGESGTITWQHSIKKGIWNNLGSILNPTTVTPSLLDSLVEYRAIIAQGSCYDTSSVSAIVINPTATGGTSSLSLNTICEGDSTQLQLTGATGTSIWQQKTNAGTWGNIPENTLDSLSQSFSNSPIELRAISTLTICPDTSTISTLTVVTPPQTGLINIDDTLCLGLVETVSIAGHTGTIQWQVSPNNLLWLNVGDGSTNISLTPTLVGQSYLRAILDNSFCTSTTPSVFSEVVNPNAGTLTLDALSICDGDQTNINLSGNLSNNIQWQRSISGGSYSNFASGQSSISLSPSLTDSPLNYRIIASLGTKCKDTSGIATLAIVPPARAGSINIPDDTICNGSSSSLNLTSYSGNIQWQSSFDKATWTNTGTTSDLEVISPSYLNSPTYYRATLLTPDNCADTSSIDSLIILTVDGGIITIDDDTICSGTSTNLNLSGEIGTIQWEQVLPDNSIIDLNNATNSISVSPNKSESPSIYRTILKQGNCIDTSNFAALVIDTLPSLVPSILGQDTVCGNGTPIFAINPIANAVSYSWSSNTGTISNITPERIQIALNNTENNTAQITVAGMNNCGTGASTSFSFVILETPTPSINSSNIILCETDSTSLEVLNNNLVLPTYFNTTWYKNTIVENTASSIIDINKEGDYYAELTNRNNCPVISNTVNVSIFEMEVSAGENESILKGESIILNGSSSDNFSYNWSPSLELSDNTSLTPLAKPTTSTTYTLIATSTLGCQDSSNVTIELIEKISIPNAFSPNGDGLNDTWEIENINAWQPIELTIFNRWGSKVFESYGEYQPWEGTYNGGKLPVGTYYYILNIDGGNDSFRGALTITK